MLLSSEELNIEVLRTAQHAEDQEEDDQDSSAAPSQDMVEPSNSDDATEQLQAHISEAEFMSVSNIVRGYDPLLSFLFSSLLFL